MLRFILFLIIPLSYSQAQSFYPRELCQQTANPLCAQGAVYVELLERSEGLFSIYVDSLQSEDPLKAAAISLQLLWESLGETIVWSIYYQLPNPQWNALKGQYVEFQLPGMTTVFELSFQARNNPVRYLLHYPFQRGGEIYALELTDKI